MSVFEGRLKDGRTLRIGHARVEDAAELLAYARRAGGESDFLSFGAGELDMTVEDEAAFIANLEGGRHHFMLTGVVDGAIVSAASITRGKRPRLRHIGTFGISVARSHWGLGVGKRMCLTTLDVARRVGVTRIELRVRADNDKAIRLYESVGFVRDGVAPRGIRIGEEYFDDVMMGMGLGG